MKLEELIKESIYFKSVPKSERYFYTEINHVIILLRINNFPEEPLYTIIQGINILDIEEKPKNWFIDI